MRPLLIIIAMLAVAMPAFAVAGFTFEPVHQVGTGSEFSLVSLHAWFTNTGDEWDTFTFHKDEFLPGDWGSSFCEGEICYPPFLHDIEVILEPGGSVEILVDIQVNTTVGSGYDVVTITSGNDPGVSGVWSFAAIHNECDALVIDDAEADADIRELFEIEMAPRVPGIWPRDLELPSLPDLQTFPVVFWMTGNLEPSLDADDRLLLTDYMDQGGALMLSGEDIAGDFCNPASGWFDPVACDWWENWSHSIYTGDISTPSPIMGEPDGFLGEGLIMEWDDAPNEPNSDGFVLEYGRFGSVEFRYSEGTPAGLFWADSGRLVVFGFGLENITGPGGVMPTLLDRVYSALSITTDVEAPMASALELKGNYPNPFNPKTQIRFVSEVSGRGDLRVLDVAGRLVHAETILVAEGGNELSFGGTGLSSGVYLYQIRLGDEAVQGRMVLAK